MIRVLVVEDDPDDLVLTKSYLAESTHIEFEALFAMNPQQALSLMTRDQHDVCLLDYMLGSTDGLSVFAQARAAGYTRPVILLTGQGTADVADIALAAGVSDFIEKSRVDGALLERAIRYTLERKRAEQEILALNQTLDYRIRERTAELMAANRELEGFSRSVSHDLRGPVRSIIGTSRMLLDDHSAGLDETALELLRRQEAAGKKLLTLIDALLRLSNVSRQEVQWNLVDVSALASEIAEELGSREWAGSIRFEIAEGMAALGDRGLLTGILQNLMENACKFSPNGGKVVVGVRRDPVEEAFFVQDEGIGIDMNYAHKIFVPFERLVNESEFPGTGIGLANVERAVQRHGGRIWVESAEGAGSTFYFTLRVDAQYP